jgi:hypothetical protein
MMFKSMGMGMDELPRQGVKPLAGALYFEVGFVWTAG